VSGVFFCLFASDGVLIGVLDAVLVLGDGDGIVVNLPQGGGSRDGQIQGQVDHIPVQGDAVLLPVDGVGVLGQLQLLGHAVVTQKEQGGGGAALGVFGNDSRMDGGGVRAAH